MATLKLVHSRLAVSLLVVGAIALSVLARSTQAQTTPPVDCQNANDTPSINYCAGLAYEEADRLLNETYQQFQSTLSDAELDKLAAAQRAWIEYRDKNCDFEVRRSIGGTGYPTYLSGCLERVTRERTAELEQQQRS